MKFFETELKGSYIIELEKLEDERGFFTRIWDKKKIQDKGLASDLVQMSFSFTKKKGTLRGMHFQKKPFEETKPDYIIILPWNLKDEIMEQMKDIKKWGGRFVIPIPEVKIYS